MEEKINELIKTIENLIDEKAAYRDSNCYNPSSVDSAKRYLYESLKDLLTNDDQN